jgi:hypothetical protein
MQYAQMALGVKSALDEQAHALGLCRSTTWTILRGHHKASGLSAMTINRILSTPELPPLVRVKLFEYVEEKRSGLYGHNISSAQRFSNRIIYR